MGRPVTTGIGVPVLIRMHLPQLAALDDWIASQDEEVSRPEAARRLIAMGLESAKKGGRNVGSGKSFEQMERNPRGDWTVNDIQTVCREYGLWCEPPSGLVSLEDCRPILRRF